MPIDNLLFQGINRAISDFSANGACEELINLRPTTAGLVPVKPFALKFQGVNYERVYEHKASNATNFITFAVTDNSLTIGFLDKNGNTIREPLEIAVPSDFNISCVSCAAAGNYILFSITDKVSVFKNIAFLWNGTRYKPTEAEVPSVSIEVDAGATAIKQKGGLPFPSDSTDERKNEFVEALSAGFNAIQEDNPTFCFGPVIIAIAFKTKDGKTFWTGNWFVYNPLSKVNITGANSTYRNYTALASVPAFRDQYGEGYHAYEYIPDNGFAYLTGVPVTLNLSASGWNADTSFIKSIEVYASSPALYNDPNVLLNPDGGLTFDSYKYTSQDNTHVVLPQVPYEKMKLDEKLLYLQKSIPMEDAIEGTTVELEFGGGKQKVNTTLKVDAGATEHFGKLLSFNTRFHFFDGVANEKLSMPSFSFMSGLTLDTHHVFVVYNDGFTDKMYYVGTAELPIALDSQGSEIDDGKDIKMVVASSLRIKQVIVVRYDPSDPDAIDTSARRYMMEPSKTYNYSICTKGYTDRGETRPTLLDFPPYSELIEGGTTDLAIVDENNAINVTEQFNPFVFNVDNSYLAPGHVRDLQPQMVAVKDVSFGDYPLNIFTDRGVYALLQGSGAVLYGNVKSISNLVSESNAIPTDSGTFIIASGNLWLIAGATAVLVSDALSLGPHDRIRFCAGYEQIAEGAYHTEAYVSKVPFEEFVNGANLSYNKYRSELIISNKDYLYSYVLSIKYRQWFKISKQLSQDTPESDIIMERGRKKATVEILDMSFIGAEGYTLSITLTYGEETVYGHATHTPGQTVESVIRALFSYLEHEIAGTSFEGIEMSFIHDSSRPMRRRYVITLVFPMLNSDDITATFTFERTSYDPMTSDMKITGGRDVYDCSDEQDVDSMVHLQSRPFSFAYQFSHIHRVVAMIEAMLSGGKQLIVSLYGSDDMRDWKLISFADRKNVPISQIRTPAAAHSWRYYTLCIGGTAPYDTDFGPVMIEYVPIIRRLG